MGGKWAFPPISKQDNMKNAASVPRAAIPPPEKNKNRVPCHRVTPRHGVCTSSQQIAPRGTRHQGRAQLHGKANIKHSQADALGMDTGSSTACAAIMKKGRTSPLSPKKREAPQVGQTTTVFANLILFQVKKRHPDVTEASFFAPPKLLERCNQKRPADLLHGKEGPGVSEQGGHAPHPPRPKPRGFEHRD